MVRKEIYTEFNYAFRTYMSLRRTKKKTQSRFCIKEKCVSTLLAITTAVFTN